MEPGSPSARQDWTDGLLERAWAAVREGEPATAQRLLIAAKHDRADVLEPELAELEAVILAADGSLRAAADLLERAAREAEPGEAARLLAAAVQPSIDAGRQEHALELAQAARALARDADPVVRLRVESMYADACAALGDWGEAHRAWRTAAEEGERAGLAQAADGRLWLSEACHCAGINDRARDLALVAAREARQAGATRALASAVQLLFSMELVTGRMRPAAAAAEEELELAGGLGRLMDHKEGLGHLAWCAAHAAEADRCRELVAQRYELGERLGDDALLHPALGVLELGLGNAAAAVSAFRRTLRTFALRGNSTAMGVLIVDGEVVEALLLAGHEAEARAHLAGFEQEARVTGRPHALSLAHRCRGLLAEDAEPGHGVRGRSDARRERAEAARARPHAALVGHAPAPSEAARRRAREARGGARGARPARLAALGQRAPRPSSPRPGNARAGALPQTGPS